jgi:sugar phosphate isomerase/epimerase
MTPHDPYLFPLGVSFHTLDSAQQPETAKLLNGSSVQAVELWEPTFRKDEDYIDTMRRLFSAAGVMVRTVHANFGGSLDISSPDPAIRSAGIRAFTTALDLAVRMGAHIVIVHPSSEPILDAERPGRMDIAKRSIKTIAGAAGRAGCQIALELLPRSCLGHSVEELLDLLEVVDDYRTAGVCLDTNHLMADYTALPEVVRKLGPRLIALHCSDYDGVDEKHWPPGQGVINWTDFLQALKDVHFPGPLHFEATLDGQTPAERLAFLEINFRQLW